MKNAILKNKNINKLSKMNMMFIMLYRNIEKTINCNYLYQVIWLVIKVKIFITK